MKKFPIFIDTESLKYIPEIEKISKGKVIMEYYYPDSDRFTITKEKHIENVRKHNVLLQNKNRSTYEYKNNELNKFLKDSIHLPYGRFYRFFRPDSPAFFAQTFLGNEALPNKAFGEFTRDKKTLEEFNKIVTKLKELLEIKSRLNKDIYVLAAVIYVNNYYKYFLTLETNGSFTTYLEDKRNLYFKAGEKLFLTNDSTFPFTRAKQIESAFPSLCIEKTKVFINDFGKYIS